MAEQPLTDPFELQRFVDAQERSYAAARTELTAGAKRSHWMWFIFPQLAGLGRSLTSQRYALSSLDEARAYLEHPVLGPRLRECAGLVANAQGRSAREILGSPDDVKLRSSMTLFAAATAENAIFEQVLQRYFGGERDPRTLQRLRQMRSGSGS